MSKRMIFGVGAFCISMAIFPGSIFADEKPDLPPFDQVSKDYEKVTTTPDGSFYNLWIDRKRGQLLAELPRGWETQRHYIAITQASGAIFAGLQGPSHYVYWKKYDK